MPSPTNHAKLSASSAHRWLACTAAPTFEEQFPSSTSIYAEKGTLAHALCELKAECKMHPAKEVGVDENNKRLKTLIEIEQNPLFEIGMKRTAEFYADYLWEKALSYTEKPYTVQEVRVDFSDYVPGGFGTCDSVMIGDDLLHITDYKNGSGVVVSAKSNPQMRLYALGALKKYAPVFGDKIKRVSMAIVQPNVSEQVEEDCLTVDELKAWGDSIRPIAVEAYNGPGTFCPGDHCKFCRGRSQCRARANQNTALEDFKDFIPAGVAKPPLDPDERNACGLPPLLSDDEIGHILILGKNLVEWYEDLKSYALQALLDGRTIPGFKVVEGKSNRAWADQDAAFDRLKASGIDEAILYKRVPETLSQLEKNIGKRIFSDLVGEYICKPSGKPTLAAENDKRPVYSPAAADFKEVT